MTTTWPFSTPDLGVRARDVLLRARHGDQVRQLAVGHARDLRRAAQQHRAVQRHDEAGREHERGAAVCTAAGERPERPRDLSPPPRTAAARGSRRGPSTGSSGRRGRRATRPPTGTGAGRRRVGAVTGLGAAARCRNDSAVGDDAGRVGVLVGRRARPRASPRSVDRHEAPPSSARPTRRRRRPRRRARRSRQLARARRARTLGDAGSSATRRPATGSGDGLGGGTTADGSSATGSSATARRRRLVAARARLGAGHVGDRLVRDARRDRVGTSTTSAAPPRGDDGARDVRAASRAVSETLHARRLHDAVAERAGSPRRSRAPSHLHGDVGHAVEHLLGPGA